MRTVLFFFCLNSLGIVLVLTQARQPSLTGVGCKMTRAGREYNGLLSVTRSGRTCQPWYCDDPHKNHYKKSKLFPEGSAVAAGNKCRNPDKDYREGVWCYTTDPKKRWEECNVEFCLQRQRVPPSTTSRKTTRASPTSPETITAYHTSPETTLPSTTNPETTSLSPTSPETIPPSPTSPETTPASTTNAETTATSTTNAETTATSTTNAETTATSTTNAETTATSTTNAETTATSTTNAETTATSTENLMTSRPITTPYTTSQPSTADVSTRSITLSLPLPQTNGSRTGDAAFTDIVVIIIPIVGVIAVVCVIIIAIIIIWKRRGFFQAPWRCLDDEGSPSRSRINQQKNNMAANTMYKPSENPDNVNCQPQSEMPL